MSSEFESSVVTKQVISEVKALRKHNRHDESLSLIESMLEKLPWHPDLAAHWSECLCRTGQYRRALKIVNDAISRSPTPLLYQVKASNFASAGQFKEAILCIDSAPESFKERLKRSRINLSREEAICETRQLREVGSYDLALESIRKAFSFIPETPPMIAEYSTCLCLSGQFDEALQVLNKGIDAFEGHFLHMEKARFFSSQQRFSEAIEVLQGSKIPIDFTPRIILLARIEFQIGNRESAIALVSAKKELPSCAVVYAELLRRYGKAYEALTFIRNLWLQHPGWEFRIEHARCLQVLDCEDELNRLLGSWQHLEDLPQAYYQFSIQRAQRLFDYHRVIELASKALEFWPNWLVPYQSYLVSSIQLRETELTVAIMDILYGKYGNKAQAQRILAIAWSQMGEHDKALECIQDSVKMEPNDLSGCIQYVDKLNLLGFSRKALAFLNSCPKQWKQNEIIILARARTYWSQGLYEHALDIIRETSTFTTLKPNTVAVAVDYFIQLGCPEEARVFLQKMESGVEGRKLKYSLLLAKIYAAERDLLAAIKTLELQVKQQPLDSALLTQLTELQLAKGDIYAAEKNYLAKVTLQVKQNKARSEKHINTPLGQQINEYKLLRDDMPKCDSPHVLGNHLYKASDNSLLAITVIRKMYELDRFSENKVDLNRNNKLKIPLKIFQYWNSSKPPEQIQNLIDTCRTINSDCEHTLFNDTSALAYLRGKGLFRSAKAFKIAHIPATKADILRLALLWCEGGIYLDADDLCLKPFNKYLDPKAEISLYIEPNVYSLANNFMASKPKLSMMKAALMQATDSVLKMSSESTWFSTGPALITRCFVSEYVANDLSLKDGADVFLMHRLRRFLAPHQKLIYKQTDQHWIKAFTGKKWTVEPKVLDTVH